MMLKQEVNTTVEWIIIDPEGFTGNVSYLILKL